MTKDKLGTVAAIAVIALAVSLTGAGRAIAEGVKA